MPSTKTKAKKSKSNGDEAQALTAADMMKMINGRKGWEGTVMLGSDPALRIQRIPTGILTFDTLLGGGFARDRHFELYGPPGVGKTAVVYRLIGNAQRMYPKELAAFCDVEGTYDPDFAEHLGVNTKKLVLHKQKHGNRVIDFMELLTRSRTYSVIGMDSIAALLPLAEVDADMEAGSYGTAQAKLMSAALRRLTAANSHTALVYINQQRENIGGGVFGKKFTTSGGRAMGFYAGTRVEMVMTESIKANGKAINPSSGVEGDAQKVIGHRVLARIEKDKTGGATRADQTSMVFDYRINNFDPIEDLMYLGRVTGLVHKSGSKWWVEGYEDEQQAGRGRFKKWLGKNRAVASELKDDIEAHLTNTRNDTEDDDDDAE
jgi:recombination protein RecA